MTPYQLFLAAVLFVWPLAIFALLYLMSRLESYVSRTGAGTPEEAGLEPVAGETTDREVKIVFGDRVGGEPQSPSDRGDALDLDSSSLG